MSRCIRVLSALSLTIAASGAWAAPPANSPYFTDVQTSQVQDATSQSIGQVNMITCVMSSMRPDALVNQGPYIALIDQNKCNAAKQTSTSNSGSSSGGTQAPNYMTAVVNSTRASNSDPMIVAAWISLADGPGNQPATIYAHISASEAPSSSNPYGTFRLDYCGLASGVSGCLMNGYMQAGNGTLSYYEADQNGGGNTQTTALQLGSVGTSSGSGSVSLSQTQSGQNQMQDYNFAYDASYFYRQDGSNQYECFSRDATNPGTLFSVGEYGLYDSNTGAEINLNSGFPIQYTVSGTTYQGYVGYYGLSTQAGAPAPTSGSTVQMVNYQNNAATTTNYTFVSNGGSLARFTQQTTNLKSIDQLQLNVFVGSVSGSSLPDANTQYVINWNEATLQFVATGEIQCGQNGCQTVPLSNGQTSVSVAPSFWSSSGLQGWSQSLGNGGLFIALNNPANPIDATSVVYYTQDLVYPDDPNLPSALYCVDDCPTAATLQAYLTQGSSGSVASPYLSSTYNNYQPSTSPTSYTLSGNVLTGGDGTTNAVIDTDANAYQQAAQYPNGGQYQNGVMSGHLVANLSDAQCGTDAQTNQPQYCDWVAASAPVYYQWQTGPNPWNQFTAVTGSNNAFVQFAAPLNVNFTVPANTSGALPYGNYAGTNMVLQYGGFGNLWGIPGTCVSSITNQPIACNDPSGTAIYISAFEIPFDAQLGVVTSTTSGVTTTYLVKWLNRQILLAQEPTSTCTGAGLTTATATLPTANGLQNPSSSSSSVYNGVEPSISSAPRVIQGQVMY
jgi:hypothetical protein